MPELNGEKERLKRELEKLRKINEALMSRVERSLDAEGSSYSIFQHMVALEDEVKKRTAALETALERLEHLNTALQREKEKAEAAEGSLRIRNEELARAMDELKQAQAEAIRAEKLASIGTLSAGVAHEILNPLNIISTIIQVMRMDGKAQDMGKENLDEIIKQVKRAAHIIGNLGKFAHMQKSGEGIVNIEAVFDKAAAIIQYDLRGAGIAITKDISPAVPGVRGDESMLEQMFLNLLTNARDALIGRAGGEIRLAVRRRNGNVAISFSDNGQGIPQANMGKIFDPFFTTKDPGMGTGLGLSMVHSIVAMHTGAITVESAEGKGTTFTIILPCGPG